jgi:hypothetical protein
MNGGRKGRHRPDYKGPPLPETGVERRWAKAGKVTLRINQRYIIIEKRREISPRINRSERKKFPLRSK